MDLGTAVAMKVGVCEMAGDVAMGVGVDFGSGDSVNAAEGILTISPAQAAMISTTASHTNKIGSLVIGSVHVAQHVDRK